MIPKYSSVLDTACWASHLIVHRPLKLCPKLIAFPSEPLPPPAYSLPLVTGIPIQLLKQNPGSHF